MTINENSNESNERPCSNESSSFPDPNNVLSSSMIHSTRHSMNPQVELYQDSLAQVSNMMSSIEQSSASDTCTNNTQDSSKLSLISSDPQGAVPSHNSGSTRSEHSFLKTDESQRIDPPKPIVLGGVVIPPVPPNSSTAIQVQAAAAAAAAAAVPESSHDIKRGSKYTENLTEAQKKRLNRERNKEHAKSTRARKKAYINKLKELIDGLHAEQAQEATTRRVEVQQLADIQRTRRSVLKHFLKFHGGYESNPRKWATIVEDNFVLKQPVTPYRSFRCSEIENSRDRECRKSVGIDALIADSASIAVMVESVGSRSSRWKSIKRDHFLRKEEIRTGKVRTRMPRQIEREDSRFHHAISSLSSSSAHSHWLSSGNGSGNGSGEDEEEKKNIQSKKRTPENIQDLQDLGSPVKRKKVSCSSSSGGSGLNSSEQVQAINTEFHDYNAKPLPDPKLDRGSSAETGSAGSDSITENDSDNAVVGRDAAADSSSGDEINPPRPSRQKREVPPTLEIPNDEYGPSSSKMSRTETQPLSALPVSDPSTNSSLDNVIKATAPSRSGLPPNIARSGGIVHNIQVAPVNPRLNSAPAISLPPFTGLGRRTNSSKTNQSNNISVSLSHSSNSDIARNPVTNSFPIPIIPPIAPNRDTSNIIGEDNDGSSDDSTSSQILAFFHVNEDDMLLTDDVLMCPFIFRTQDAVLCGALAECVMPGMLRAQFSPMNKLVSLEMVYDAMGFMQQLGRASGNEGIAEIIPNSLDMALQPSNEDARVITTAKPPYAIVSANAAWTHITKYSQMEAEQKELTILDGKRTFHGAKSRPGKPSHDFSSVASGRSACSTNVFYDKYGKSFIAFVSSYPLTNAKNDVTHLLHVYKSLNEYSN